jgi:hypothetical protein
LVFCVSVCVGRGGWSGHWGGGGGGDRVASPEELNSWLPSEVNRFKNGFGRCGTLYADKVTKCLQQNKLDLQLTSNVLQDIQKSTPIVIAGCSGCAVKPGGTYNSTTRAPVKITATLTGPYKGKRAMVARPGASSDAIEVSHLIEGESVLLATDEDLNKACKCFSKAFDETMIECKIRHIMCKSPLQTCSPVQSCPLVQPNNCAPKSGNPQTTYSYSCDVDYCTEGTGTCGHSWWATANNLAAIPATCDDSSSSDQIEKNQETFGIQAKCQILRPNKRSTTYTVVLTTVSPSPAGLSSGAIAGIVVGLLVTLLAVGAFIFLVFNKAQVDHQ